MYSDFTDWRPDRLARRESEPPFRRTEISSICFGQSTWLQPQPQAEDESGGAITWDSSNQTGGWTLTNSNLTAEVASGTGIRSVLGTVGRSSGRRYFEIQFVSGGTFNTSIRHDMGLTSDHPVSSGSSIVGAGGGYRRGGAVFVNNSNVGTVTAVTAGDVVGVAVDFATGSVWFSLNDVWTQGDPAAATSPEGTIATSTTFYPGASSEAGAAMKVTLRSLNSEFTGTKPAGFASWASA